MKKQLISVFVSFAMLLSLFPCKGYASNDSECDFLFSNAVNDMVSFNFDSYHLTVGKIYDDIYTLKVNGETKLIRDLNLSNDKILVEDDSVAEILYVNGEYYEGIGWANPPYLQLLAKKIGSTTIQFTIDEVNYNLNITVTGIAEESTMIYMTPWIFKNNWTFAKQETEIDYYTGYRYMDAHYIGNRYCFVEEGTAEISFVTIVAITSSSESAIVVDYSSGDDSVYFKGVGFGSSIISCKDTSGNIHTVELMVKLPDELKDTSEGIIYITNLNNGNVAPYTKVITLNEYSRFNNAANLTIQCFYYQGLYKPLISIDDMSSITYSAFIVEYDQFGKLVSVDSNSHSYDNPITINKNHIYRLFVVNKIFIPY